MRRRPSPPPPSSSSFRNNSPRRRGREVGRRRNGYDEEDDDEADSDNDRRGLRRRHENEDEEEGASAASDSRRRRDRQRQRHPSEASRRRGGGAPQHQQHQQQPLAATAAFGGGVGDLGDEEGDGASGGGSCDFGEGGRPRLVLHHGRRRGGGSTSPSDHRSCSDDTMAELLGEGGDAVGGDREGRVGNHNYSDDGDDVVFAAVVGEKSGGNTAVGAGGRHLSRPRRRKRRYEEALTATSDEGGNGNHYHPAAGRHGRGGTTRRGPRPATAAAAAAAALRQHYHRGNIHRHNHHYRGGAGAATGLCGKKVQAILLAVASTYLFLIVHIYREVTSSGGYGTSTAAGGGGGGSFPLPYYYVNNYGEEMRQQPHWFLQSEYLSEKRRLARSFLEERKAKQSREAGKAVRQRVRERQRGTRPPPAERTPVQQRRRKDGGGGVGSSNSKKMASNPQRRRRHFEWYSIWDANQLKLQQRQQGTSRDSEEQQAPVEEPLATMEELCGFFAQTASLSVLQAFQRRDALTTQQQGRSSESTSPPVPPRVLLAGHVVSSSVAVHLASTLHEECLVPAVLGLDDSASTTRTPLEDVAQPLQFLKTTMKRGWKELPLHTVGALGLDPKLPSKDKNKLALAPTGQIDLVKAFRPTHIVYFPPSSVISSSNRSGQKNKRHLYRSWIALEQILASIAASDADTNERNGSADDSGASAGPRRPHLVFVSYHPSLEILANLYALHYGVFSVGVRVPNTIFGPWERRRQQSDEKAISSYFSHASVVSSLFRDAITNATSSTIKQPTTATENDGIGGEADSSLLSLPLDLVYAKDAAEGLLAAMQVRLSTTASVFQLRASAQMSYGQLQSTLKSLVAGENPTEQLHPSQPEQSSSQVAFSVVRMTKKYLEWYPSTSLQEGLVRTLAWYMDHSAMPPGTIRTGDELLQRHSLQTCPADDVMCHSSHYEYAPCLSECSTRQQCLPSIFDGTVPLIHEVVEGCDIVLYTQAFGKSVNDLKLETEYMEESVRGSLVCGIAFVSVDSELVQKAMQRVPDADLTKFGIVPQHDHDHHGTNAITKLKREKLNGRLLYRGWLLLWPTREDIPDSIPHEDEYLLKLAPGKLFPEEVQKAVYIEQNFAVAPKADDIMFLVDELYRPDKPSRVVAAKSVVASMKSAGMALPTTGTHFRIPAQTQKRAALLLSQLRFQESSSSPPLPLDKKMSLKQASRFMRFENGEDPISTKEPTKVKDQREFYERVVSVVKNALRPPSSASDPLYVLDLKHWARTRWVVHDMKLEAARRLRCDWYQEHMLWDNDLDQLSFAFIMAKREYDRRIAFGEVDDRARTAIADSMKMKHMLTDVFEWHPLKTETNRGYSPYDEIEVLGHDPSVASDVESVVQHPTPSVLANAPLFVRIISDRVMATTRKTWNIRKLEGSVEEILT